MSEGTEDTVAAPTLAEAPAEVETEASETVAESAGGDDDPPDGVPPKSGAKSVEDGEEPEKPKRPSGYDRMKRKNQYLQSEILRLREEASRPAPVEDKAPREEDFGGDWGKYIAATAAYEAAKAVKGTLAETKKSDQDNRIAELRSEVLAEFEERTEAFKSKATDFDEVVSGFVEKGGKFSDAVRELVMESDVGPQLTYHLAKHPAIAKNLNSLPPLQAAKEIARLEDTLSKPSTKATKAPPPIGAPRGGTVGNFDPARASMDEYIAKRKAGWGA